MWRRPSGRKGGLKPASTSVKHLADEVLLASQRFVIERARIVAVHLKTARRSAGGRLHEELDRIDLRAGNAGVADDQERRRRNRVEHLLFIVRGQLGAQRVGARGND